MVSQAAVSKRIHPLKGIIQRLESTPNEQLPHIIPLLTSELRDCGRALSGPDNTHQNDEGVESGVLVHKFKTQLTTLLQAKTLASRWSAVVLIKATVEVGGLETLNGAGIWVRSLLGLLVKADPPATKKITIITLARIFLRTHGHQSLTRELTTPSLPSFVTNCLNLISIRDSNHGQRRIDPNSPLVDVVLQVLIRLQPLHPQTFRPFHSQIRGVISPLLAPTPSTVTLELTQNALVFSVPKSTRTLAQCYFALLPQSAPKSSSNDEWTKAIHTIVNHIHRTSDHVFRAVLEDWSSPPVLRTGSSNLRDYSEIVGDSIDDELKLPEWRGIHAGAERLEGLLELLQTHIATTSPGTYTLPLGTIIKALSRILAVFGPSHTLVQGSDSQSSINLEVSREEREGLWTTLPKIHSIALDTLSVICVRVGNSSLGFASSVLDLLTWVFRREQQYDMVRTSTYYLLNHILQVIGSSLPKAVMPSISLIIRAVCTDVLPDTLKGVQSSEVSSSSVQKAHTGGFLPPAANTINVNVSTHMLIVRKAAYELLPQLLSKLSKDNLSPSLRHLLDQTAILAQHKEAMLGSVLNPRIESKSGKSLGSIMPLVTRAFPDSYEVEALLRPRMPVLQSSKKGRNWTESESDAEDEDEDVPATEVMSLSQRLLPQPVSLDLAPAGAPTQPISTEASSTSLGLQSPKRGREVDAIEPQAAAFGSEEVQVTKRPKLTVDDVSDRQASPPKKALVPEIFQEEHKVSPMVALATRNTSIGVDPPHPLDDDDDSDGSFEIPPIIVDTDSDEMDERMDEEDRLDEE